MPEVVQDQNTTDVDYALLDDSALQLEFERQLGAGSKKITPAAGVNEGAAPIKKEDQPQATPVPQVNAEAEKVKSQLSEKEAFIKRQAQEIGDLRKIVSQSFTPKQDGEKLNQKFFENPSEAAREVFKQEVQKEKDLASQKESLFKKYIPDLKDLREDIAKIAKEEGEKEEDIQAFLEDPTGSDLNALRYYTEKAKIVKKETEYQTKIKELEEKIATIGTDVAQKIQKAAKETKTLTGKTGQETTTKVTISEDQIPSLSDAELNEALKESTKKK